MKNFRRFSVISVLLLIFTAVISFFPKTHISDIKYKAKSVSVSIKGTSTLHDWEMKSSEGTVEAVFVVGTNNKLSALSGLSFVLPARSLKSGHNVMDKNTYKALKTDAHQHIAFTLSSSTVTPLDARNYQIKCVGKLTIAGSTKETELVGTGKLDPSDNSLTITGTKKMKMTDYDVKPPTVMMGTVKTGNDISINYQFRLTQ